MDNRFFNFMYDRVKDKRCDYGEVTINYICSTIDDILSDFEINLTDKELRNLCCKVYNQVTLGDFDNKILDAVKENLGIKE